MTPPGSTSDQPRTVREGLERSGARRTPQRLLVADIIDSAPDHLEAREIYLQASAQDPRMSLNTVYRTLALLQDLDLVVGHYFTEEHAHFEAATGADHHHVVCRGCGKVHEFRPGISEQRIRELASESEISIERQNIELIGLCSNCRTAKPLAQ